MQINRKEEIIKRRKEVFFAYYLEDMSAEIISYLTGYSLNTIVKDLKEIQMNIEEYKSILEEY